MNIELRVACVGLLGACCAVLVGCAEADEPSSGGGVQNCIAGQNVACACPDGTMSFAVCTPQGLPGMCMCGGASGGAGGLGGTSGGGLGGASGMASGGASGVAGMMTVSGGAGGMMASGGMGGSGGMATTGGMGGSGGMTMTGGTGGDDVPDGETCAATESWDPAWVEFEEEVLRLTNEARAEGADCGAEGTFGAADPLTMSPILRCSARLHSMDMGEQGYFAHDSQDGRSPFDRMADAGYMGRQMGENIAKGQQTPEEVVNGWIDSDGHCANIMNPGYTEIGVGYWEGEPENMFFNGNKLWTQNFGTPGGGSGSCPWPPQFCN